MTEPKKKKRKKSQYCEYAHNCDKDIDCKNGAFCQAFQHSKSFTSLRFKK